MTRYLVSDENPSGHRLEDILHALRAEVLNRCTKITCDRSPQAREVLTNNIRILGLLGESIDLAEDSSRILTEAFGPSRASRGGPPRIGEP
ncbi:MAG: histidine kinase [Pseudomonadota bacterium]